MNAVSFLNKYQMRIYLVFQFLCFYTAVFCINPNPNSSKVIWEIGKPDNSSDEFALAPDHYSDFLKNDFGWEDRNFIIGISTILNDWPYALSGPADFWGGTSGTAGWRSSVLNILFDLEKPSQDVPWKLIVDLHDSSEDNPPLLKITINGKSFKYQLPYGNGALLNGELNGNEFIVEIPLTPNDLKNGVNKVSITTLQGSWIMFDQVRLEGPKTAELNEIQKVVIKSISPASFEVKLEDKTFQPLLVEVEHISSLPKMQVLLDGKEIFNEIIETGSYEYEVPMPAVLDRLKSEYKVLIDGKLIKKGEVDRAPYEKISPSGYVDTMIGTAHSRWMLAPGPWMPFSMVKLSPDNQDKGWQAGYDPIFESIGGFSHIHEWTLSGLLTMPTNGPLKTKVGEQFEPFNGYRSLIDKSTEESPLGFYKVHLTDYDIWAELTSTTRCSFQRYTFPEDKNARILLDLYFPSEYDFLLDEVNINLVNEYKIEGYSKQRTPNTWSGGITQEYIIHFVVEFDQPIARSGVWTEKGIETNVKLLSVDNPKDAGMYVEFGNLENQIVQTNNHKEFLT